MIKYYLYSFFVFYFSIVSINATAFKEKNNYNFNDLTYSDLKSSVLLEISTTSKSSVWSPNKVIKLGDPLIWKATASGMTDQIISTNGTPVFDFSVSRTSSVTITATSSDGSSGFTELGLNSLNINSINTTNATHLNSLSCTDNQISKLDVTNNIMLIELFCHSNQLTELDITQNIELTNLACFFNNISILDLSQNIDLTKISCSNNLLKNLDLSNNTDLISLECDSNRLENLNIQNENNSIIESFKTTENLSLFCIQVDDISYSTTNWKDIDTWTSFNEDCTFTNEPPVANDDFYEVDENMILNIEVSTGVLINDIDPDHDVLMAILHQNVEHGILDLFADGSFMYEPSPGYFGTDTFTYIANDGEFDSNIATVTIEIIMVNQAPISNDNDYITPENTTLTISVLEGVLSNDTDPDGDSLSSELLMTTTHGDLILSKDGAFTYTPFFNYYGIDSFSYRAFDGFAYSDEALVTITIEAVSEMVIPNAFTPNNDGLNDFFRPVYRGMSVVELQVFDTWGNLVYIESGKELSGWNGVISNKSAENGNYLYLIEATTNEMKIIKRDGLFTLIN